MQFTAVFFALAALATVAVASPTTVSVLISVIHTLASIKCPAQVERDGEVVSTSSKVLDGRG